MTKSFKEKIKNANDEEINDIYIFLKNTLFSGNDIVIKERIKADEFHPAPLRELIYPKMLNDIKNIYSDSFIEDKNNIDNIII